MERKFFWLNYTAAILVLVTKISSGQLINHLTTVSSLPHSTSTKLVPTEHPEATPPPSENEHTETTPKVLSSPGAPEIVETTPKANNLVQHVATNNHVMPGNGVGGGKNCPILSPEAVDVDEMDALTQDQFITKLTDSCRYDKLIKPPTHGPLPVSMQIDLTHIESADQLQFKAHMLVQYLYRDQRLKFNHLSPHRESLLGEELLRNKIWVPHIMIRNERDTSIMGIDGKDVFVSISPHGDVVYSYRMTATFYCWMNLKKFPFDSQDCFLKWNSWTYNTTNLILLWDPEKPYKIAPNLHLTEFVLDKTLALQDVVPASFTKGAFVGNFSELTFQFKLSREVGYYIMDYFLPSILLVCTSWVSFWLQADAAPPRVTLGTATMLAFITLNGGLTKNLPKVSYIKASEIWFLTCACFIFCSMAEFAFVNVIWRRKKKVELKKQTSKHILKGALTPSLARKQLRKAESINSLYKTRSCTSLDGSGGDHENRNIQSNYLTVHSFPSTLKVPTITTQSQEEFVNKDDSSTTIPIPDSDTSPPNWHTMTPHEVANWIDKKSRIVFPVTFIIFNLFYWSFVYVL